jgi:hypothetical protein
VAENKTKQTDQSVQTFLDTVEDSKKREDCMTLVQLMQDVSGQPAKMWGSAIIGFGSYHYKYESGREGDAPLVGFSPRKQNLTLYIRASSGESDVLLSKLGKHKSGKGCVYVNRLSDIDLATLKEMVLLSVEHHRKMHHS